MTNNVSDEDIEVIDVSRESMGGFFANAAAVLAETISSPQEDSLILVVGKDAKFSKIEINGETGAMPAPREEKSREVSVTSHFKLIFLAIVAITVASGIIHAVLAAQWPTPTANQQSAFEAFGFAWKAGIGAILGLIGGKAA